MAAAEEYDWTRPYRTWEATLKKQDEQEDAAAATKRREAAAAAAACGGCRNLDRTEERALFAQPAAETLQGAQLAVERGERMFHEGRLERSIQWYEKALVAYDYAFPEDGETQALLDATRRDALLGSARVYLEAKLFRAALRSCREVHENDEARLLEARACRELDLFDEARTALLVLMRRASALYWRRASEPTRPTRKLCQSASSIGLRNYKKVSCLHQSRPASATS